MPLHERLLDNLLSDLGGYGPDLASGRKDESPFDDGRLALFVQERDQSFSDRKLHDDFFDVDLRVLPEGLGRGLDRFLVAGSEGPDGMLDTIAELSEGDIGDVEGILADEIDADALGPDEPDDLLDLLEEDLRGVGEQEMRLVEEKDELGLIQVSDFGGSRTFSD